MLDHLRRIGRWSLDDIPANRSQSLTSREEIERVCMRNLLASRDERVFFKDLESRFLLVSGRWLEALGQGALPGAGDRQDGL
jgi:hypothetical protein